MLLSLFLSLLQLVQQDLPSPQVINTQNGLSNNIVYETFHDRNGYLWIATDNGLNRYDGYDFKVFYHDSEDSTTISNNIVRTILEDPSGNLWVGTFDGINLYNPKTETFTRFKNQNNLPKGRLDLQHIYLDKQGKIWINSLRTIGWFDTKTYEFGFVETNYHASTMTIDGNGDVWASSIQQGSGATIAKYDPDRRELITQIKLDATDQQPLHWGEFSKSLWIKDTFAEDIFEVQTSILPKLPNNVFARELLETDPNTLWIGTDIGLFIYKQDKKELKSISLGTSTTLTSAIRSIELDSNGGVWVGTLGGLFHFDAFQKPFNHIDIIEGAGDVIMGIEQVSKKMYLNALGNGLYEYNLNSGVSKKLSFRGKPPMGFNFIWKIKSIPESNYPLWLATDAGLILYNPENGHWKDAKLHTSNRPVNPSFSIFETDGGFIWVSTQEGIHQVRKSDGQTVKNIPLFEYIKESIIQDLTQIDNQLFIATEGFGTIIYNTDSEVISLLSDIAPEAKSISATPTWQLFEDGQSLWLATSRGLFQYNTITHQLKNMNDASPLGNRIIFSIEKDANGLFWMGTERGLVSFDPRDQKTYHYTDNDGLVNIEFNRKSVKKSADGLLYFGGVNGITVFDPNRIQQNTVIPQVRIKSVEIITSDSIFNAPIKGDNRVVLPYNENTVQIDFVAINFTNPEQNQYQHQLVGYDPGWVKYKSSRQARYVRLPPGKYEFKVMGANNDGLWNPVPASFSIEILPPFWQTWWFKSLIILSVSLILWAIYKYRVRRLLEVERMKLRIAGDLHDEVGSGLSGIALTGDLLQRQVKNGGAKPELVHRITNNARNLASSLDAIVWLIDPQKESLEDFLIKTRAVGLELLANSKFEMLEELTTSERARTLSAEQKRNLFLITKEALHNTAKHAHAEKVTLTIYQERTHLKLSIADNGKGFDIQNSAKGHGLSSMQNRADQLNATFTLESTPNKGSKITLSMKLP